MKFLSTVLLFIIMNSSFAGGVTACESTGNGTWSNPATWTSCSGSYPDNGVKSATIKAGHVIDFDLENITIYGLSMEAAGELHISNSFSNVTFTTSNGGFNSQLGHVFVNSDSLIIDAQIFEIRLGKLDGAAHLVLNTTGNTFLLGNVGETTSIESLTTNAGGLLRTTGSTFNIFIDGTQDTVINDNYAVGASSRANWTQSGVADIIFNGTVKQTSGSPQQLTVNLTGGGDVHFNDEVRLGRLTTNGTGNAVINTASMITVDAGANDGDMIFNTPVLIATDVTFTTENTTSDIFFNASLDDDGDLGTTSFVTISTPNELTLNAIGQNAPLDGLNVTNSDRVELYGDITTFDVLSFDAPVFQYSDVTYTNPISIGLFIQTLNAQSHNAHFNFGAPLDLGAYGSNLINVDTMSLGPLGTTEMNGGTFSAANHLIINNQPPIPGDSFTVNAGSVIDVNSLIIHNDSALNSSLEISVGASSQILGDVTGDGSGSLIKSGSGELFIPSGTTWSNLLSMDVSAGTLNTENNHNNLFTVFQSGKLIGSGSVIANTLNLNDSGSLSPGSGSGDYQTFTVDGLNISSTATLVFEISGSPSLASDRIDTTGGIINLDGNLSLLNVESSKTGDEFTLINNTGIQPISGIFSGFSEGAIVAPGLTISYVGGDGNDVVLTAACDAQIIVTESLESGAGSLRQAVADVCDGGEVIVDSLTPEIQLLSAITIDKSLTISGNFRTISGGGSSQIFNIGGNGDVTLNELQIINANSGNGAIRNQGILNVNNSYFANNEASQSSPLGGGALINFNTATISNSTFYQNNAQRGGALFNDGPGVMVVNNSTFYENGIGFSNEGGVLHNRGTTTLNHVTMVESGDGQMFANTIHQFGDNAELNLNNSVITSATTRIECRISGGVVNTVQTFIDDASCNATLSGDAELGDWPIVNKGLGTLLPTLSPLPTSPLVNAADTPACLATDQLGTTRPQGLACDIGAIEITDNTAPEILAVTINYSDVQSCGVVDETNINSIAFTFNERVVNAELIFNYEFTHYSTNGIENYYEPITATSDNHPITPTITLSFPGLEINEGLIVFDNIDVADEFGNDFDALETMRFRFDPGNLLTNGHFDDCGNIDINNGWQYGALSKSGLPFVASDFDSNSIPYSGSVSVELADQSTTYSMEQCVDLVSSELPIYLEAEWVLYPNDDFTKSGEPEPTLLVTQACEQWDQTACMGQSLGESQVGGTVTGWGYPFTQVGGLINKPAIGSQSARCQLTFEFVQGGPTQINVDSIRLSQPDLIFENGFEEEDSPCGPPFGSFKGC